MPDDLTSRIVSLTEEAADRATSRSAAAELRQIANRARGPLRLAIAGRVKAGKSTLLNALIGEDLAPTDAGECTRIVTWYVSSPRPYARLYPVDGDPVERPYRRGGNALQVDLGGRMEHEIDHLEIGWPTGRLRDFVLIDTPGIASISTDVSLRTHRVMTAEEGRPPVADAVLYLLRYTHSSDLRFLEAFHDDEVAHGTPINTVGVLSRADEIGSCRLDAMQVATQIALRYEREPRLRRLCPMVIPVNGLLGHAAATLREAEYTDLTRVAAASDAELAELLLTADRFVSRETVVEVPSDRRRQLLDRIGLYGVRVSVEEIRSGRSTTLVDLCAVLADLCGLERLRNVVTHQFESRARVLKARSAVDGLRGAFDRGLVPDPKDLLGRLEEITSSAHEFEEVRVLFALRAGDLDLEPDQEVSLDRLMGGAGHEQAARLGLPQEAPPDELHQSALIALGTWREIERHPLSSRTTRSAARAAIRTIEGMLRY